MGVYAHRFIEVQDKANEWQLVPLLSKFREDSYGQPDVVVGDLKLRKHSCFLSRASSGFYSTCSLYSVEDISHPIDSCDLSEETREYLKDYKLPIRWETFSLTELEAYADKCREKVYSELADAFHDNNMRLIVGMLVSTQGKEKKEDSDAYYHTPRYTFDEYMESYQVVMDELQRILFVVDEVEIIYDWDRVRVVFFYA